MGATTAAALGATGVGQLAGGVIAATSIIYLLRALWCVTPICGAEPWLFECLRFFYEQDHPRTQLIFGLRDPADLAIPVIERVIKEFPGFDLALVIDGRVHGRSRRRATKHRRAGNKAWPAGYESCGEFEALTDPDVTALTRRSGIEPVCFARLDRQAA